VSKGKILIVEDEFVVAEDIRHRLTAMGHSVAAITPRGDEAVRLCAELRPSLVLMDIRLQGEMDGVAATSEIRKRSTVPVVYLTAHADEATMKRAQATEPFAYVVKPFDEEALHNIVQRALHEQELHPKPPGDE
jgi:CheY-like chemotaxis protein